MAVRHRRIVKEGLVWLGRHFLDVYGVCLDLRKQADLAWWLLAETPDEELACRQKLNRLDADMQHCLHCTQENGGMFL
jgi:hypothetical protein